MGDIKYGSNWWNRWQPQGCRCWGNNGSSFTGAKCDKAPDNLKVYDSFYSGEDGYYLAEVPSDQMANEMLKEILATPRAERPAYWQGRNVPVNMRGLFWTSYNNGVTSFLHNQPGQITDGGKKLKSNTVVFGQNVWSWSTTTLYTVVDLVHLNYEFIFSRADAGSVSVEANGSNDPDRADIIPHFRKIGVTIPGWLSEFTMKAETHCANCRAFDGVNNPHAGTMDHPVTPTDQLNPEEKSAQQCKPNECWRRYTTVTDEGGDSSWEYDLTKIVDEYGEKVEPGFSNWVKSLQKEDRGDLTGTDKSLLARCMPNNPSCKGDTQPGQVGVQGGTAMLYSHLKLWQ
jgi:hypothetical protein